MKEGIKVALIGGAIQRIGWVLRASVLEGDGVAQFNLNA